MMISPVLSDLLIWLVFLLSRPECSCPSVVVVIGGVSCCCVFHLVVGGSLRCGCLTWVLDASLDVDITTVLNLARHDLWVTPSPLLSYSSGVAAWLIFILLRLRHVVTILSCKLLCSLISFRGCSFHVATDWLMRGGILRRSSARSLLGHVAPVC